MKFEDLIGKTFVKIEGAVKDSDEIIFIEDNGKKYQMYHDQDCCESV